MRFKKEFLKYIAGKFRSIEASNASIFAEYAKYRLRSCIIMAQHTKKNKIYLMLILVKNDLIYQIALCQAPHFSQVVETSYYRDLISEMN